MGVYAKKFFPFYSRSLSANPPEQTLTLAVNRWISECCAEKEEEENRIRPTSVSPFPLPHSSQPISDSTTSNSIPPRKTWASISLRAELEDLRKSEKSAWKAVTVLSVACSLFLLLLVTMVILFFRWRRKLSSETGKSRIWVIPHEIDKGHSTWNRLVSL